MQTRSCTQSNPTPLTPPQQDVFHDILERLQALQVVSEAQQQQLSAVWSHVFDKPESSGEKDREGNLLKDKIGITEAIARTHVPLLCQATFTNPRIP
jgi:hypothetical protein